MQMQPTPQIPQQQPAYGRQLNAQAPFRVGASASGVGQGAGPQAAPAMSGSGGGAMAFHSAAPSSHQPQMPASDQTPQYHLNLPESQGIASGRERQQYGGVPQVGHRGGGSGYYQQTAPQQQQQSYGQGRPTTPGGYQHSSYGYAGPSSAARGMYQQGSGTPHTATTPTTQQQATYGMRTAAMYNSQPQTAYGGFPQTQQQQYGQHYGQGVVRGAYGSEQVQQQSGMGQQQRDASSGFQQRSYGQAQRGGGGGRYQGYGRSGGRGQQHYGGGFRGRPGGRGRGRGRDQRGPPMQRGRGGPPPSLDTSTPSGPVPTNPTGAAQSSATQQTPQTATDASGRPTPGGPTAPEDPNVPAEKPAPPRRMGIEPPTRNLLQFDSPMYQEAERFFRVLSFDVLGDKVWRAARLYQKPPVGRPDFWSWDYRKEFLVKEVTQYQPDAICLQEVDQYEFFEQQLAPLGYVGIYEQRKPTGQSREYVAHGLAIFWQSTKFEYMGRHCVPLGAPYYVNEIALCVRLRRCDPTTATSTATTAVKSPKNVVLDIWNTHLIEGRNSQQEKRRLRQALELVDHMARVSSTDFDDRSLGRLRPATVPLMEPKAKEVDRLTLVDPSAAPAQNNSVMPGRELLDMETNKEDHPENKELELPSSALDMDPESKEHEPGNELQELFRSRMKLAITEGGSSAVAPPVVPIEPSYSRPPSDYNTRKQQAPAPERLRYPVILCGNFNCAPFPDDVGIGPEDAVQPVTYTYLTYSSEPSQVSKWLERADSILGQMNSQPQKKWILDSTYASTFGEPKFTVWPDKRTNQKPYPVDYIFYTKNRQTGLSVLGVLEPLSEEWVEAGAAKSLPCHSFPSDHIPLIADFEYRGGV